MMLSECGDALIESRKVEMQNSNAGGQRAGQQEMVAQMNCSSESRFRTLRRGATPTWGETQSIADSFRALDVAGLMTIRILVIEDDPEIADFVVRGLREEGYEVDRAIDGEAGWQAMTSASWDLILLDWTLPPPDGMTLLRRFRQQGQATPVLFLTARDAVSDRVKGLDSGADDYLCKPFAFEELLARIRSLVRRQNATGSTALTYLDVRVDLVAHAAQRNGRPLVLTATEESLLVFFLKHPHEVLSRTRIYENVWDERYDGLSNRLEVHVVELRRKLELHGARLIHTVRGRGYLFGEKNAVDLAP